MSSAKPITIFAMLANKYRPINPKIPDTIYMMVMTTNNTAGVRNTLKIFLLSLCLANDSKESFISYKQYKKKIKTSISCFI